MAFRNFPTKQVLAPVLTVVAVISVGWFAMKHATADNRVVTPTIISNKTLLDECTSCHTASTHADLTRHFERCAQCHSGSVGALHLATATTKPVVKRTSEPIKDMALPMYSEDSHIGNQPNEMVSVPAGEFVFGTNERLPDEGPEQHVVLDAFWIGKYEVTNFQYRQFIDVTQRKSPTHFENRTFPAGKADHPVTFVSWQDADAYCQWAHKRLPTDREWEKAARGVDGRSYPWGNDFSIGYANTPQRWKTLEKDGDTTPVGAFPRGISPYGAYDMSGNVWEWTASWYMAYPGNQRQTENYGEVYKTLKGGSWWDCSFYKCGISSPTYNRAFFLRTTKNKSFGFRCAKDAS